MNTRIIVATVAGGAALFLLGFLVYDLLLGVWMKTQMVEYKGLMNETPNFVTLIVANVVWALLVALIFDRWASISTFLGGLIGGAMISFLMALYFDLMNVSFMNLYTGSTAVLVDVIAFTVIGALAAGVIAAVLGMMNNSSVPAAA
jgi:Na+/serine symporter